MNEAEGIRLNGFEVAGEAYETLPPSRQRGPQDPGMRDFCKTEYRPYDKVVGAVLIAAAVRALDTTTGAVKSDGRWDNWAAGVELFRERCASADRGREAGPGARRRTDAARAITRLAES